MSRYSFDQHNGGTLGIGWDPGLNTFFLQIDADRDEPAIWKGTSYGEHPEPEPLVALARKHCADVPEQLVATLRTDKAADPAWAPVEERIARGDLAIRPVLAGTPADKSPPKLSPAAALRWWAGMMNGREVSNNDGGGGHATRVSDPARGGHADDGSAWRVGEARASGPTSLGGPSMFGQLREFLRRLTTPPIRIDLDVPFACKDQVKRLGGRWDAAGRTWYIDSSYKLDRFAQWIPSSPEYRWTYLDVPFRDKDEVRRLGAQWDAELRLWYVPSGVEVEPFARWLEPSRSSLVDTYHRMDPKQGRYLLFKADGGMTAEIYLDDLEEVQELAAGALRQESFVELHDTETREVWRGAAILELRS